MQILKDFRKYINIRNKSLQFFFVLLGLILISLLDLFFLELNFGLVAVSNLFLLFASVLLIYEVVMTVMKSIKSSSLNIAISSVIAYVVIHPDQGWWTYPLLILGIILGKHYIRTKTGPIFNPVALSIFFVYLFSVVTTLLGITSQTLFVSWWGADLVFSSLQFVPLIAIFALAMLSVLLFYAKTFRKLYVGGYTLLVFTLLTIMFDFRPQELIPTIYTIWTGSFAYLAFVMMTEPKTTPIHKKDQIIVGVSAGIILYLLNILLPSLGVFRTLSIEIPSILTILLANALWYGMKVWQQRYDKKNSNTVKATV